ncbi:short-chain dehydrogenase TIC 32, chloroplastic-like [Gossypium australe]|uniref:Short-chain dehydrogenase TIC 32, chloroplastic-like n=1 Tax=Gossypium australe TaxID=47621 RepID=A0A5B6UEQ9_9ROSI|nr:short-chain dehydrogenase TIC 32, chloroplastic-like [Gossypium australe]
MWFFGSKGPSGFSSSSTAEEVTQGIDGSALTAIVTGASSGIGVETTRVLALRGVHVVMAVRNVDAGRNVKEAILKEIPGAKIDVMELDLSSMASIRKFASQYQSSNLPLNLLINNAGVVTPFMLSHDGIELQFATNYLGSYISYNVMSTRISNLMRCSPFLLTDLLSETMKKTARESNIEGRIVNVSSIGHRFTYSEGIRFDKINDESGYSSWYAYGQSKLATILHAKELSRRLKVRNTVKTPLTCQEDGVEITANSLHPGGILTNIMRHNGFMNGFLHLIGKYFLKSIPQGAATTCYVALHPQVKGVSGEFFMDSNISNPSSMANDVDLAKKLWDFSFTLINPNYHYYSRGVRLDKR